MYHRVTHQEENDEKLKKFLEVTSKMKADEEAAFNALPPAMREERQRAIQEKKDKALSMPSLISFFTKKDDAEPSK